MGLVFRLLFLAVAVGISSVSFAASDSCADALEKHSEALSEIQHLSEAIKANLRLKLLHPNITQTSDYSILEVAPGIYYTKFRTQREMTKTLLRFQEFYESPKYRGEIFKLKEFKDWYKTTSAKQRFSYYEDWGGFNFPSYVAEPFFKGAFDPLSRRENEIMEFLKSRTSSWYFIAGFNDESLDENDRLSRTLGTLHHEMAHAFYYQDEAYRNAVDAVLDKANPDLLAKMRTYLEKVGYHPHVVRDEQHANLSANMDRLLKKELGTVEQMHETVLALQNIFWQKLSSL